MCCDSPVGVLVADGSSWREPNVEDLVEVYCVEVRGCWRDLNVESKAIFTWVLDEKANLYCGCL